VTDETAGIGDNIHAAAEELRLLLERAERLEEEKKGLADDLKDVKAEVKSRGYDVKAFNLLLSLRKSEAAVSNYRELRAIVDTYAAALGMNVE